MWQYTVEMVGCRDTWGTLAIVRIHVCYDPIRNLTRFEAGQPALKWVNPFRSRLTGFATSSSPQAGFKAGQLRVKHFLTWFTTIATTVHVQCTWMAQSVHVHAHCTCTCIFTYLDAPSFSSWSLSSSTRTSTDYDWEEQPHTCKTIQQTTQYSTCLFTIKHLIEFSRRCTLDKVGHNPDLYIRKHYSIHIASEESYTYMYYMYMYMHVHECTGACTCTWNNMCIAHQLKRKVKAINPYIYMYMYMQTN